MSPRTLNEDRPTALKLEPMLTTAEASQILHVHINTLRRWTNSGIVRAYRIGPRADRRFRKSDIVHALIQIEEKATR